MPLGMLQAKMQGSTGSALEHSGGDYVCTALAESVPGPTESMKGLMQVICFLFKSYTLPVERSVHPINSCLASTHDRA